jgi:hypothetical protein
MAVNKDGLVTFKHHQMGKAEITDVANPTLLRRILHHYSPVTVVTLTEQRD